MTQKEILKKLKETEIKIEKNYSLGLIKAFDYWLEKANIKTLKSYIS